MQYIMRCVTVIVRLFAIGLIVSACAVLTKPAVTPPALPPSTLPTATTQPPAMATFPASPLYGPVTQPTVTSSGTKVTSPPATPLSFASVAQILDLAFTDPQHGWFLATSCGMNHICPIAVHATYDGGQTWQVASAPVAEAIFSASTLSATKHVDVMRFANANRGWIFNPDFFSTHDGGQTWTDEKRSITALEIVGQSVWAVEQRNEQSVIIASNDLGQTWKVISNLPIRSSGVTLVRANVQTAWILARQVMTREAQLIMTDDEGNNWHAQSLPLYAGHCTSLSLARSSDKKLWLLCGDGLATAMQPKWLYTSVDNGATWDLVANNDPTGTSKPQGRIPIVGHMLDSRGFAVTSPTTAFIALNRGTLYVTHNGGQDWEEVGTDQPINLGDAAIGPLRFIDGIHGWLVAAGRIFRTVNGGMTWQIFPIQ